MDCESLMLLGSIYAKHRGLTLSTVSTYAAGSGDFYARLKRGHDVTSRRAARVLQYLSDHWPEDLPWPAEIPRPAPTPAPTAGTAAGAQ